MDNIEKNLRYARLASIEGIEEAGVVRLNQGSVLVIGCGALGSLCSMYLAASGVGRIGICDFDTIDISNLQRQLFFMENELGQSKADVLHTRIAGINSETQIDLYPYMMTAAKGRLLFGDYDFVIDGSDNPATKLMTARICEQCGIPYCIGGVREMQGQVMSWHPGATSYSDIFGEEVACSGFTPCSIGGVLGPTAGVVASMQAAEAIKHISGCGDMLYDRLFIFDMRTASASVLNIN